ncbi:MAG: RNA polymerase sigma factor [Myxococcales bacterium]|nr:RNA polymerase sigma factor [Myxococcales bacterium]
MPVGPRTSPIVQPKPEVGDGEISLNDPGATGDQEPLSTSCAFADSGAAPVSGDTEPSLLARVAERDPAAIDEVYRAHHAALRAFARRYIGEHEAAEDLVHDVFVALPDAIKRFRGDSSLRTFLSAIAVKRAYKHVRSASRRRAAMTRLADQPHAPSPRPDAAVAQQQLAALLYAALDKLSDDHRTAFVLCEIDQLTAGEAAALTGAPEATMRTRLFHARAKLRALLEEVPR